MSNPETRIKIAKFILDSEARRDKNGNLKVYKLPPADGGGSFEVAGINDGYHPAKARELAKLIGQEKFKQAEKVATEYLAEYTDVAEKWTSIPAVEAFLRDSSFNRGPKGALRILQIAVGVADDGKFGPITKAAVKQAEKLPGQLLLDLRQARETYERKIAPPVGKRAAFWKGLNNRWNKALEFSQSLL